MTATLKDLRPVYVVGIGLHRYQFASDTPYVALGLTAVRAALQDAALPWGAVEAAHIGRAVLPMAAGRAILRHLGATGLPIAHAENASASGSTAFRHACFEVAAGFCDVALALGVDKPAATIRAESLSGIRNLADFAISPATHYALLADRYASRYGAAMDDFALVAVKNHRNGAKNPFAQHQKERSLEEILGGKKIAGSLTSLQCTPIGEGAAAVIIASESAVKNLGLDPKRAIRVTASAARSQRVYEANAPYDAALTAETTALALQQAKLVPQDLNIVELHDAFSVEELEYVEAMGLCGEGRALPLLKEGAFDIGGVCAVNPSGGLIAMGHPIGPTGVGQIAEIVRQLRGEAGARQHPGARRALAHMVGLGAVCYVHVLEA